jgi:pyridoxamine 5'-phosphate oxidase
MPEPHEDGGLETEAAGGNKWGALTFTWAEVERCVRVEGLLEPLSREESLVYWQTRERGSKIGGWASWQSSVLWEARGEEIPTLRKDIELAQKGDGSAGVEAVDDADGRGVLEARVREVEERFRGVEEIPLPPFWGGMRLVPESVEFWQGRRSRLHDRFRFVKEGEGWKVQRLSP